MAVADPQPCACGGDRALGAHTTGCPRVYFELPGPGDEYRVGSRPARIGAPGCECGGPTGGNCGRADCDSPWRIPVPKPELTGIHHVGWDLHAQRGTKPYDDSDTTGSTW